MKLSKNARYFWGSFSITLCVILLACGLITADYHTRWIGFGDDTPIACIVPAENGRKILQIRALGANRSIDVTGGFEAVDRVRDFIEQAAEEAERILSGFR